MNMNPYIVKANNDNISRKDAIDALSKLPNAGLQWYINFECAMKVLLELPPAHQSILSEEERIICKLYLDDLDKHKSCNEYKILMALLDGTMVAQQWTPCSEGLPKKYGVYIVTDEYDNVFEYDYSEKTMHNGKWSFCGNEIVAWMPLPKSYKESER